MSFDKSMSFDRSMSFDKKIFPHSDMILSGTFKTVPKVDTHVSSCSL